MNDAALRQAGASAILRDGAALSGALARPQAAAHYEQADPVARAVKLIEAIALAHAFFDGNKRTALIAGATFLDLNGFLIDVAPGDDSLGRQIEALVTGIDDREGVARRFEAWLRPRVKPKP